METSDIVVVVIFDCPSLYLQNKTFHSGQYYVYEGRGQCHLSKAFIKHKIAKIKMFYFAY